MLRLPQLTRPPFDEDDLELLADVLADQTGEAGTRLGEVPGWSEATTHGHDRAGRARARSETAVRDAQILVTTGAGGVGKTTSAAASGWMPPRRGDAAW